MWEEAALILAIITTLGVPMSWKKTGIGLALPWVGFDVTYIDWEIGVLRSKVEDLQLLAQPLLGQAPVSFEDFQSFVGKLTNMVQTLAQLAPLLQPLHAFAGAAGDHPVTTDQAGGPGGGRAHHAKQDATDPHPHQMGRGVGRLGRETTSTKPWRQAGWWRLMPPLAREPFAPLQSRR